MNAHRKRWITSLILLPLLAAFFLFSPQPLLCIGLYILSLIGLWEFYSLFWPGRIFQMLKIWGFILAFPLVFHQYLEIEPAIIILLALWILNFQFLLDYGRGKARNWSEYQIVIGGLLYVPLIIQFLQYLLLVEIVLVFAAAFICDTGAYYFGTRWGRKKLWPSISPKKSWMGAWGGLFACALVCLIIGALWGRVAWFHYIWIGIVLGLASEFGDLVESALKRQLEVKDSGNLLPGHGGFLDSVDSVLLALPVYMAIRHFFVIF